MKFGRERLWLLLLAALSFFAGRVGLAWAAPCEQRCKVASLWLESASNCYQYRDVNNNPINQGKIGHPYDQPPEDELDPQSQPIWRSLLENSSECTTQCPGDYPTPASHASPKPNGTWNPLTRNGCKKGKGSGDGPAGFAPGGQ